MYIFELTLFWITIAPTYYWLMYAFWFIAWYYIISKRWIIVWDKLESLFYYVFLWVILWWRLWYILFYNLESYLSSPLSIFKIWEWWMSFHGWVIWVILALIIFSKKYKISFLKLADQITLVLPIWLWFWRFWNYLNKELLWYSWYDWFLAVYKNWIWYFPSPLVEAILEWLILFLILNYVYKYSKNNFIWKISSLFLILYWLFRIFVEIFFREADSQIWLLFWFISMWSLLSIPMILLWIYIYNKYRK